MKLSSMSFEKKEISLGGKNAVDLRIVGDQDKSAALKMSTMVGSNLDLESNRVELRIVGNLCE